MHDTNTLFSFRLLTLFCFLHVLAFSPSWCVLVFDWLINITCFAPARQDQHDSAAILQMKDGMHQEVKRFDSEGNAAADDFNFMS